MRPKEMKSALRFDLALALFPEIADDLSSRPVRSEPVVAVLSSSHPLAQEDSIRLEELSDESLLFPREVAPRLHDFYVDLCHNAGFEARHSAESARTRWMLGTWDKTTTALVPDSVSGDLPRGAVAVPISDVARPLETQLVWRNENQSPALAAFVEIASGVFASEPARSR